jgi:hypothetical protein
MHCNNNSRIYGRLPQRARHRAVMWTRGTSVKQLQEEVMGPQASWVEVSGYLQNHYITADVHKFLRLGLASLNNSLEMGNSQFCLFHP